MMFLKTRYQFKTQLTLFSVFCCLVLVGLPVAVWGMNTPDQIQYSLLAIIALYFWSSEILKLSDPVPAYKWPLLIRNACVICLLILFAYSLVSIISK